MIRVLKWLGLAILLIIIGGVAGCSTFLLPRVNETPETSPAKPDLLAPIGGMAEVTTQEAWRETRALFWRNMLLSQVYGSRPADIRASTVSRKLIDPEFLDGKASLIGVQLSLAIGAETYRQDVHFVVPNTKGPHPVILGAGSCPNDVTLPFDGIERPEDLAYPGYCDHDGFGMSIATFIFGRYIETPPLEALIDHGFAFGAYYPGMIVPDASEAGLEALAELPKTDMDHGPYGAVGIWAWVASRITDYVETDHGLDETRVILFGHSRSAKVSLLAGALDPRIAGVIAHQSGTGGASVQKNGVGESIAEITETYPHWFSPSYALYAERADDLPFDQHALVALMAPRPLLLGNSARDKWSDPKGAFTAAKAAGAVYALLGSETFDARDLGDFHPQADLAFQFREGTHGITPEDWTPFLAWLDAHFSE